MKKVFMTLVLVVAVMLPWATRAQSLTTYSYTTGVDASKWIPLTTTTSLITANAGDDGVSNVQDIGFTFPFGERTADRFSVNADGNIRLSGARTGTSAYTNPFNADNASSNGPKINLLGCDGYLTASGYVYAQNTIDADGDSLLVIEVATSTYSQSSRSAVLKWQVHLYPSGKLGIVIANETPSTLPAVTRQPGMCVDASDGFIFLSDSVATPFSNGTSASVPAGRWFTPGRWFTFERSTSTCSRPLTLYASAVGDTINVNWQEAVAGSTYEVAIVTAGVNPDAADSYETVTGNTFQSTGHHLGMSYDIYVRTVCDGDYSAWRGPFNVLTGYFYSMHTTGTDTLQGCGYIITDNGGINDSYSTYCNSTLVVLAEDPSSQIFTISGTSYTESRYDYVRIYEGIGTSGQLLFDDYGVSQNQQIGPFTTSVGAFTVTFVSDGSGQYDGFAITASCMEAPDCPVPTNFTLVSSGVDTVILNWDAGNFSSWEVAYGPTGMNVDTVENNIVSVYDTVAYLFDLQRGVSYDFYLRTDCGMNQSFWVGPVTATPGSYTMAANGMASITACGLYIYDDGGQEGSYSDNSNSTLTLYPAYDDSLVVIQGVYRGEACCDHLYIYDGPTSSSPLLATYTGTFLSVGPHTATNGPLTLVFTSDGSTTSDGFELYASCAPAPECKYVTNVEVSHIAGTSALISWQLAGGYAIQNPTHYALQIVDDATGATNTASANQSPVFVTALNPNTSYTVRISAECEGLYPIWDSVSFSTGCISGGDIEFSNGTNQVADVPVNSAWGNTANQSIFTAAELQAAGLTAGPILGLRYTWTLSNSYNKNFVIFIDSTSQSSYATTLSTSSWLPLGNEVYNAPHTTGVQGSVDYQFTTPYVWDGVSNLVITTFMNQPAGSNQGASNFYGLSTPAGGYMGICKHQDNNAFTAASLTGVVPNTALTSRPTLSFLTPCDTTTSCGAPNVTIRSLSDDEIELMWAPGNNETAWTVLYQEENGTGWTTAASNITTTHYTLTNLDANTTYTIRIVPNCGSGNVYGTVTATTVCSYAQLPFVENFDNGFVATSAAGSATQECWHRLNNHSTNYPYIDHSVHESGSSSMYFYGYTNVYSALVLPAFQPSVENLSVSFAAYKTNSSYSIQVGAMTDPEDISTFVPLANVTPSAVSSWENFEINLGHYDGNGHYVAFRIPQGAASYMYIDNIEVDYISSCPRPTQVTVSNIGQSTANISWTDADATLFEVEYGPNGFTHGQGTIVSVSGATNVALTGLSHSTPYDVYVRGLCYGTDTSRWSFAEHFTTACGSLDVFPYTESFDAWGTGNAVQAPNCWSHGSSYSSNYPYISTTCHSGVGSLFLYNSTGTNSSAKTWAMMPAIDTNVVSMNQMVVTLYSYSNDASYHHPILVGVSNDESDISSFTAVDTIYPTNGTWQYHEVFLDQYTGNGKYVTFVAVPAAGERYSFPYIDDVTLDIIPSCPRPEQLTSGNATTNSVELSWTDRGTASSWIIEYGPQGFHLGNGTTVVAHSNPFTLTNLPAAYAGEYYVRALCGSGDSSAYSRTGCLFNTTQAPASVPYSYDFENASEWSNWRQSTNIASNVHWARGTVAASTLSGGSYGMFCTADDSTAAYVANTTNTIIYRDIDFGSTDTSFVFGFDAYMGGFTNSTNDGLMVFLVDPSVPVVSPENIQSTPWGNIDELHSLASVRRTNLNNNGWTRFVGTIDNLSGVHRIAFCWHHMGSAANFSGNMAMVDNISIEYAACPRPLNVTASRLGATAVTLTWRGPVSAEYEVTYHPSASNSTAYASVHAYTNSVTLTGLTALESYDVWVRKICGNDTSAASDTYQFQTIICDGGIYDTIGGHAAGTSYYIPTNNYYGYTLTETIVDSAELAAQGIAEISAIAYNYAFHVAMDDKDDVDIYIGHTPQSVFAGTSDAIAVNNTFTHVYSGDLNCTEQGWNLFHFDTTFVWDGHSNIVIVVDDNSNAYDGSNFTFRTSPCQGNKTLTYYSDDNNPDCTNPAAFTDYKQVYSYRADMILVSCAGAYCGVPAITSVTGDYANASIAWTGNGDNYEIEIKPASQSYWNDSPIAVQGNTHTFTGLTPETDYLFRVRLVCDADNRSEWSLGAFTTDPLPCFVPTQFRADEVSGTSVSFSWQPGSAEQKWMIKVWNNTYADSVIANTTSTTINGLVASTTYQATIKAICNDNGYESPWSSAITFTTTTCAPVSDVAVSDIHSNTASISWTNNGDASQWEIEYGISGFGQGEGTIVQVTRNPYTIRNLEANTSYDVYVRAICGNNWVSDWSSSVTFRTSDGVGIEEVANGMNVTLYPNPTSGATTISLSGVEGEVVMTIVDLNGRKVFADKMECASADCEKTINVENLAQGTYFVRLQSQHTNMVKRLIVK